MKSVTVTLFACLCLFIVSVQAYEDIESEQELHIKYVPALAKVLDISPEDVRNSGEDVAVLVNFDTSKKELGAQIGGKIATKVVTTVVSNVVGSVAGAVLGGFVSIMGFVGDAVQRDKCKLRCCPKRGLPTVWGCKYQSKKTCNGHYSDYPGHGDHACWWNAKENRCEAGMVCRDKTFNGFALFGSVCPSCPKETAVEPQWRKKALRKAGLPEKFYVQKEKEYLWCAPRGSPGRCRTNKTKKICEISYADHHGDKNCVWKNGRCTEDHKCDNSRQRKKEAKKLGLKYSNGAWRRKGIAIHYDPRKGYVDHKGNRAGSTKRNADLLKHDLKANPTAVFKVPKFISCLDACAPAKDKNQCAIKCTNQYAFFKTGHHGQRKSQGFRK